MVLRTSLGGASGCRFLVLTLLVTLIARHANAVEVPASIVRWMPLMESAIVLMNYSHIRSVEGFPHGCKG